MINLRGIFIKISFVSNHYEAIITKVTSLPSYIFCPLKKIGFNLYYYQISSRSDHCKSDSRCNYSISGRGRQLFAVWLASHYFPIERIAVLYSKAVSGRPAVKTMIHTLFTHETVVIIVSLYWLTS